MAAAKHKSRTVSKLNDPRAASSRAKINAAFVALLHRRSYVGIRVSDITRKAGVGRATFYAHYESKHELLRAEMRSVVVPMLVAAPGSACLFDCTGFFAHVRHARLIYRSLAHGASHLVTERIMQECFEERIAGELRQLESRSEGPDAVVGAVAARFVAASLLSLVAWWVENDTKASPQEMQAAFEFLVGGGLQRLQA